VDIGAGDETHHARIRALTVSSTGARRKSSPCRPQWLGDMQAVSSRILLASQQYARCAIRKDALKFNAEC